MKRIFPTAKPEYNSGKKMTQVIQTRTPLEALKMLRAGQPIDLMLGYFVDRGEATKDVYMMDRIEKLHLLEELKENQRQIKEDVKQKMREQQESLKQQQHGESKATNAPTTAPAQNAATV